MTREGRRERGTEREESDGRLPTRWWGRGGRGKVLGSTFPKRRWRLNLTVPRVIVARDPPVSFKAAKIASRFES